MTVAAHEGSALAIQSDQPFFNDHQIAALRQLGVAGASNGDLAVFFHQSQRTGLDPFRREIYMIQRKGKWTIQTGIDGFYKIADRAARASHGSWGIPETLWCGPDGQWVDVWLRDHAPAAAKVTVVRDGSTFTAVAVTSEYKASGPMWEKMPARMIAKCAEALAIRKAFPQDLSGLYTSEEMSQADQPRVVQVEEPNPPAQVTSIQDAVAAHQQQAAQPEGIHPDQAAELGQLIKELGLVKDEYLTFVSGVVGREVGGTMELTAAEADLAIDALRADPANYGTEVHDAEVVS